MSNFSKIFTELEKKSLIEVLILLICNNLYFFASSSFFNDFIA